MEKTTTDHTEIKEWVEKNGGRPEVFDHPGATGDTVGLRISFPGSADTELLSSDSQPKYISWEKFLELFEEQELAFIYEDGEKMRDLSYAYRFIKRDATG